MTYQEFCRDYYQTAFRDAYNLYRTETHHVAEEHLEPAAQKKAIQDTIIAAVQQYPAVETAQLWEAIYAAHVHRKSGIKDRSVIENVISADQSWKKSSGHAFEEFIKDYGTRALSDSNIEIVLQRDLNAMIQTGELNNESRDIDWLKIQVRGNIFDLYSIITRPDGRRFCYGCIQSKTSIRDRVTRDREPSIHAMQLFFWSSIVTLDGRFLALPKFTAMVNGGTDEFRQNGWHGMYVFSEQYTNDRIYPTDLSFRNFKEHAVQAAQYWLTQRQWFTGDWKAVDVN